MACRAGQNIILRHFARSLVSKRENVVIRASKVSSILSSSVQHGPQRTTFRTSHNETRRVVDEEEKTAHHDGEKWDACDRITKNGAVVNIGLSVVKGVAGSLSGSPALVADAVHSLSDLVSDGVTLWTTQIARTPRDAGHPYGHGRFETLGALGVGGMLGATGVGMGWHSLDVLRGMMEGSSLLAEEFMWVALCVAGGSLIAKEALFQATMVVGRRANSKVVMANAWHHRSDALSSLVAVIGVGGSIAGAPLLDPLAGVVVSGLIVKTGVDIASDSLNELVDGSLEGRVLSQLADTARKVDGVVDCRPLRGRRMGAYMSVDLQVEVHPYLSVSLAHSLRCQVARQVMSTHEEVIDVFVVVVPAGSALVPQQTPKCPNTIVEQTIRNIVHEQFPEIAEISHLTMHVLPPHHDQFIVIVDIVLPRDKHLDALDIAQRLQKALQDVDTISEADIHLDLTTIPSECKSMRIVDQPSRIKRW